jgi:hypothetical protein
MDRPKRRLSESSGTTASSFLLDGLEPRLLLSGTPLPDVQTQPQAVPPDVVFMAGPVTEAAPQVAAAQNYGETLFSGVELGSLAAGAGAASAQAPGAGATWVLDQEKVDRVSNGQAVAIFGDEAKSMNLVVGSGSGETVVFGSPRTVLRGDTVRFDAPVSARELVVDGDGTTATIAADVSSASITFIDSLLVEGVRTLTASQGGISVNNDSSSINGKAGGASPDSLILSATGAISLAGNIGDQMDANAGALQDLTITNATTITFGGTVRLDGNLVITRGTSVNFKKSVNVTGNVTILDGGAVSFSGTLVVGGNLVINKASGVSFASHVSVGGNVSLGNSGQYGDISGGVFFSGRLDYGGSFAAYAGDEISFGNQVGSASTPRPLSMELGSLAAVSFSASVNLGATVPLVVWRATDVGFYGSLTAGSVTIGSGAMVSGNINFTNGLTVNSLLVQTTGTESVATFGGSIRVGRGGAVITANNMALGTTIQATDPGATLTLKPFDPARNISVGNNTGVTTGAFLEIDQASLGAIKTGTVTGERFAAVQIGDAVAGVGTLYLGNVGSMQGANGAKFLNPTHLFGGSIEVVQDIDVTLGAGLLRLVARSGDITISGSINAAFTTTPGFSDRCASLVFQAAGSIVVNRPVYASDRLSLVAGTDGSGSVTVNGSGTNSGLLATVDTSGTGAYSRRIEIVTGMSSGDLTLNSTTLTAASAPGAASSIVLAVNGGGIAQTGGMLTGSNLAVLAKNNVTLSTSVDTISSATVDGTLLTGGSSAVAAASRNPSNGAITGYTVSNAGSGYTAAPTVSVVGDGQVRAVGTASISGPVATVLVTSGGSGYTSAPSVTISGSGGSGASATAVVSNGVVVAVNLTAGGSGFQGAPAVSFSGGGGTGAAARAVINGVVTGVSNHTAGSGYTFTPAVLLSGGRENLVVNGVMMVGSDNVNISQSKGVTIGNVTTPGSFALTTTSGDIAVGYINALSGAISLTAAGALLDATTASDSDAPNIASSGLVTLRAATGIGSRGLGDMDLAVGSVNATNTGSGDVVLNQLGIDARTLIITGISNGGSAASTGGISVYAESQAGQTSGGSIIATGAVSAAGSGDVLLQTVGTTSGLTLNASVSSGSGSITVLANDGIFQNVAAAIATGGAGTIDVEAQLSSIVMNAAASSSTGGGNIRYRAAAGVTLGVLDARTAADRAAGTLAAQSSWGDVSVVAAAGAIVDGKNTAAAQTPNVFARKWRLNASGAIGSAANALESEVSTVTARANAGEIRLTDATGVSVDDVAVSVNRVSANLTLTTAGTSDALQSDVATLGANGVVQLQAGGAIALNPGTANDAGDSVTAHGSGNVSIQASGGSVTINGRVSSTAGNLSFVAGSIAQNAAVATSAGTIAYTASLTDIVMADLTVTSNTTGAISLVAAGDIKLSRVQSTSGTLALTASGGAILDNTALESPNLVFAGHAVLIAGSGIGAAQQGADLNTTFATLEATNQASGGIFIRETDSLSVTGSGLKTLAGNGPVSLVLASGALTVNAAVSAQGAGAVTLTAEAASGGLVTLNAAIGSGTGSIAVTGTAVAQNAEVSTGGAGNIAVSALAGSLQMRDGTTTTAAGGSVSYIGRDGVALSRLVGATGTIAVTSSLGSISDNTAAETANVTGGGRTTLSAKSGVGAAGAVDLDLAVASLEVETTASGGVFLEQTGNLAVVGTGIRTLGGNGAVSLVLQTGNATLNAGVRADGSGNLLVQTVSGGIVSGAEVSSGTGSVTLLSTGDVALGTGAAIATQGGGSVDVESTAGAVTMQGGASVGTASGNVRIKGATNAAVTGISSATGAVSVCAISGSITDGGDTVRDVSAGLVRMEAGGGIGSGAGTGALEIVAGTLAAVAGAGGISFSESDALTVGAVARVLAARVSADGLAASSVADASSLSGLIAAGGDVRLNAGGAVSQNARIQTGATGSVSVRSEAGFIHMQDGSVTVVASGGIDYNAQDEVRVSQLQSVTGTIAVTSRTGALVDGLSGESANLSTSGGAALSAYAGIGAANDADLDTAVAALVAANGGTGGVFIHELDSLVIGPAGVLNAASGPVVMLVSTGALSVGGNITAGGPGNVLLKAPGPGADILLGAEVSSTAGNVSLQADSNVRVSVGGGVSVGSGAGSVQIIARDGSVSTTAPASRISTAGGNIRVVAGQSVALGVLDSRSNADRVASGNAAQATAWGNVSVTASAGAITDAKDRSSGEANVYARSLRLQAGAGIGTTGGGTDNAVETEVVSLAALSAAGSVNLVDRSGLALEEVSGFDVQNVSADGSASPADPLGNLEDVRTSGAGDIVVRTLSGDLRVLGGSSTQAVGVAVSGSGNLLMEARENLTAAASVLAAGGHVSLRTVSGAIRFEGAAGVQTGQAGSVDLKAATILDMSPLSNVEAGMADVRLEAAQSVVLGGVVKTSGNVSILSLSGPVIDGDEGAQTDVEAVGLRLFAGAGIGTGTNAVEVSVAALSARAGAGGVFLNEKNDLRVDDVGATVQRVGPDAVTATVTDALQSDILTTDGGAVVLEAAAALTLNDGFANQDQSAVASSGVVRLSAREVVGNADVSGAGAAVTVLSTGGSITLNADVSNRGGGSLDLQSADSLHMFAGSDLRSETGRIQVRATQSVTIGGVVSTGGDVSITAESGSILDGDGDATTVDVSANQLHLAAGGAVGSAGNFLEMAVSVLEVRSGQAGVYLGEQDDVSVRLLVVPGEAGEAVLASKEGGIFGVPGTTFPNGSARKLSLSAATGIGRASQPLRIETRDLRAVSLNGDVALDNARVTDGVSPVSVSAIGTGTGDVVFRQLSDDARAVLSILSGATGRGNFSAIIDRDGTLRVSNVRVGAEFVAGTNRALFRVVGEGRVVLLDAVRSASNAMEVTTDSSNGVVLGGENSTVVTNGANLVLERVKLESDVVIDTRSGARSGDVLFSQPLDGAQNLAIEAGGGNVTFASSVGAGTPLKAMTVRTSGRVTFAQPVKVVENVSVTSSQIVVNAPINGSATKVFEARPASGQVRLGAGDAFLSEVSLGNISGFAEVVIGNTAASPSAGAPATASLELGAITLDVARLGKTLTLLADSFVLDPSARIRGTGSNLVIRTATAGRPIQLGRSTESGAAALELTAQELNTIQPGFNRVQIGSVSNPVTIAPEAPVRLAGSTEINGSQIDMTGVLSAVGEGANLAFNASGQVRIGADGNAGQAALIAPNGDVTIRMTGGSGVLNISNEFTRLKAGGRLTIESSQPSLELTGELVVAGAVSIKNTGGSVIARNLRLNVLSTVSVAASGDIDLRGGFMISQRDALEMSAGGRILLGTERNAALYGQSVQLLAALYTVGSATSFGWISSGSTVAIAGRGGAAGGFTMLNARSLLSAPGGITLGGENVNALETVEFGTQTVPGGRLNAGSLTVRAQATLMLRTVSWSISQSVELFSNARTNSVLGITGGSLSAGSKVRLYVFGGYNPSVSAAITPGWEVFPPLPQT